MSVGLRVFPELLYAAIPLTRALGSLRVNLVEVREDRVYGGVKAVEIEAIEANLFLAG